MPFSESRCTIVTVDIADWTNPDRTRGHKLEAHRGLYRILETSFDDAGIGWSECYKEDRGDGTFILVPSRYSCLKLADQLAERLYAELVRYNEIHTVGAAIQLRLAMHFGEVEHTEDGKVGDAIDSTFRLLEAEVAKARLRESQGVLAVITSDLIYQDSIAGDPVTAPAFERIPVAVKRFRAQAWLRLYGAQKSAWLEGEVAEVLPDDDFAELRELLREVEIKRLPAVVAQAIGTSLPPTGIGADLSGAIDFLADHNAGPDDLPPIVKFAELLVRQVDTALGERLSAWSLRQAEDLNRGKELAELRAAAQSATSVGQPRLHLVVLIEHRLLDTSQFSVSYWRQDDPAAWPPPLGGRLTVDAGDIERAVDELVMNAEVAWAGYLDDPVDEAAPAGHQGEVAVEFVLPRALLNLPVDRWRKELDSPDPQPLTLDYLVVIRSLDRLRTRYWHRKWFERWDTLVRAAGRSESARVYFPRTDDNDHPRDIDVDLNRDPQLAVMVLSKAPEADVRPGDQLTAALRAGVPAILWTRTDTSTEALNSAVTHLAHSCRTNLVDLPVQLRVARQQALTKRLDQVDQNVISNMVLVWDDAHRLVILDRPWPGDRGGTNERAS